jgi:hypothetical protein
MNDSSETDHDLRKNNLQPRRASRALMASGFGFGFGFGLGLGGRLLGGIFRSVAPSRGFGGPRPAAGRMELAKSGML